MKKILSLLVAMLLVFSCAAMAEVNYVDEGYNYPIAENPDGKEVRVAVLMVNNNPFWVDVEKGVDDITETMKKYNCTVDKQTFEQFDGQTCAEAIDNCITMEYDVICTVGVSDSIIPAIDRATEAGILVYTFNSDVSEECTRVAFHGQDLQTSGALAGDTLAQLIGGEGKVAILTGLYSVPAHELRRNGGRSALEKYEGIEIVGEAETHDSGDEAYSEVRDFLTANPDLAGIYQTAGGQLGVIEALRELDPEHKVKFVCFDFMDEIVDALYDGFVDATIGQDPYGQGADPVIFGYNAVVTGEKTIVGNEWTKMDVVTPENVAEYYPR